MKKLFKKSLIFIALTVLLFALVSCTVAREYTVTFVLGDERDPVTAAVASGNLDYTPDPPSEDYVFAGWFLDESLTRPYLSKRLTGDLTLYARFIPRGEYAVTFIYNSDTGAYTTHILSGILTEPKTPVREGYSFAGWVDAATGFPYVFGTEPTEAHTVLEATWRIALGNHTFTVVKNNGEPDTTETILHNGTPTEPDTPLREGFVFGGWYENSACTVPFDFTEPMTADKSAYALWTPDTASIGNLIATEGLTSTVKINFEQYNWLGTSGTVSLGSGVIYRLSSDGYYYCLTNEHVVRHDTTKYKYVNYIVFDAYGREYTAELVGEAHSEYDLAVLRFKRDTSDTAKELTVATLAESDAEVGELLVSVGNPQGLINTVTYGECTKYEKVTVQGGSDVTFAVGQHNAPLDSGSSGGGVFNAKLELVGINFAAGDSVGAFIQITKVLEFLGLYAEFLG